MMNIRTRKNIDLRSFCFMFLTGWLESSCASKKAGLTCMGLAKMGLSWSEFFWIILSALVMLELDPEMLNRIKKNIKKNEKFLKLFVIIKSKPYP